MGREGRIHVYALRLSRATSTSLNAPGLEGGYAGLNWHLDMRFWYPMGPTGSPGGVDGTWCISASVPWDA